MSKAIVTIPNEQAIVKVEELADRYSLDKLAVLSHLRQSIMIATGIQELKLAIRPLLPTILPLMNTQLGFDTDRNPNKPGKDGKRPDPYPVEVIEDCLVEALMRGIHWTGNQMNIIASKCYTAQKGYEYLVQHKIPGLTDLDFALSAPYVHGGHTLIRCRAKWKLNNKQLQLVDAKGEPGISFAVVVHSHTGPAAIEGKAKRSMFKRIWELSTGCTFTEPNLDDEVVHSLPTPSDAEAAKTRTEQLVDKLKNKPADVPAEHPPSENGKITDPQRKRIEELRVKVHNDEFSLMIERFGVFEVDQLLAPAADELIGKLEAIK